MRKIIVSLAAIVNNISDKIMHESHKKPLRRKGEGEGMIGTDWFSLYRVLK